MSDFRVRSSLPAARPAADLSQPCAPPLGLSLATRSPGVGSQPCGVKYPRFCEGCGHITNSKQRKHRKWHTESGYSKRSKVETTFHRYKAIVGSAMRAERVGGTESRGKDRVQDSQHHDGARDA